ncbi:MAG: hypothetical protein JW881_21475 [Spirochaetales bacterium]|nr:hypothetical protein [Spirochaetales bacterium]
MAALTIKTNIIKKLTPHLREDEDLAASLLTGTIIRYVLGLTDKQRVLITSFPLIGESEIIAAYPVDEIEEIDYFPCMHDISLLVKRKGNTSVYKLPVSGSKFLFSDELKAFFMQILEWNKNSRPGYLKKDETIIESIWTKNGVIKLTNENILLFSHPEHQKGEWKINEQIHLSSIQEFDYYPELPNELVIYVETEQGESRVYRIGHRALFHGLSANPADTDSLMKLIYDFFSENRYKPAPSYLYDDEVVLTTIRASENSGKRWKEDIIVRLSSRRFLFLTADKRGKLDIKSEIGFDDIAGASMTLNESPGHAEVFACLRLKTQDGKIYEHWMKEDYRYGIEKIGKKIEEFGALPAGE